MTASIPALIAFVSALASCGYLLTLSFARRASVAFTIGCSFPLGACWYVVLFVIGTMLRGTVSHLGPLAALAIVSIVLAAAAGVRPRQLVPRAPAWRSTAPILLAVTALSSLMIARNVYFDAALHFEFAAQIAHGRFPPSLPGTFEVPFPYHVGYDVLFGGIAGATGANFVDVYLAINLAFVASVTLLAYAVLARLIRRPALAAIGSLAVMLGTSPLALPWHVVGLFYRPTDMMQQHPWKFGVFLVFLLAYAALARATIDLRRFFVVVLPLLCFLGHLATQVIPFAFATTFALYVFTCFDRSRPHAYAKLAVFAAALAATMFAMLHLGGVFLGDPDNHFAAVSYSFHGPRGFFAVSDDHNGTAGRYYFLDTAFVLAGYVYVMAAGARTIAARGIHGFVRDRRARMLSFLVGFGFASYVSPLFMRFSAYTWNDFCKFSYVGVLIGLPCLVLLLHDAWETPRYRRMAGAAAVALLAGFAAMQIAGAARSANLPGIRADIERYRGMTNAVRGLDVGDAGVAVYGVPEHVAWQLGTNLLNATVRFSIANRYQYLSAKPAEADATRLLAAAVRYVVAADDAIPVVKRTLGEHLVLRAGDDDGHWAVYELVG